MNQANQGDRDPRGDLCRLFDDSVSDLLLADVAPDRARELSRHMEGCARCQSEWSAYQIVVTEFRQMPVAAATGQVWSRLEQEVGATAATWNEQGEPELLAELSALPYRADPSRVWQRLEHEIGGPVAVRPTRRRWRALMEVAALTAAAGLLLTLWTFCNDPALAWAEGVLPDAWAARIASLGESPYGVLFVPGLFAGFAGLISMASLPLLMQAIRERPSGGGLRPIALAIGTGTAVPSGEQA